MGLYIAKTSAEKRRVQRFRFICPYITIERVATRQVPHAYFMPIYEIYAAHITMQTVTMQVVSLTFYIQCICNQMN